MPKTNAEKIGIKPGNTLAVIGSPTGDASPLGELPADVVATTAVPDGDAPDVVLLFAADSAQLRREAPAIFEAVPNETKVWIAYRKGGVGGLSRDALMPAFVDLGWHGVSLVSLDAAWSAARFRRIDQIGR